MTLVVLTCDSELKMPKIKVSICIPIHNMKNSEFFLNRLLSSIRMQSFQDYEIVITDKGKMAENTNRSMKQADGEILKIMAMDDYFLDKDSLQKIVSAFKGQWLISSCVHDKGTGQLFNHHKPYYDGLFKEGYNGFGGMSTITVKNENLIFFDENLSWLIDVDFYERMYKKFGLPILMEEPTIVVGLHEGQMSNILTKEYKDSEQDYINKKYEKN